MGTGWWHDAEALTPAEVVDAAARRRRLHAVTVGHRDGVEVPVVVVEAGGRLWAVHPGRRAPHWVAAPTEPDAPHTCTAVCERPDAQLNVTAATGGALLDRLLANAESWL